MASSFFLKLTFNSLHHFAWPFLALVYPMCASIQAIETDSYEKTKHLISYWILLSLIYLFEYAFMTHLLWFQPWLYIKLMIIFWLTIPDFGRASYVYDNLIRSMKPKIDTWRKCFVEKDNFLMHAERYMKENGSEALEKLIANKNTMCRSDAEMTNEIIATDNKEVLKTNREKLQPEHKDIKDLEAIEEKEVHVTKQDIPVMPKIVISQNASSVTVETKGTVDINTAGGELPLTSTTRKEVQKEWTCALCLVTTTSEKDLNSHLNGMRHRSSCEAALLRAKKQPAQQKLKNYQSKEDVKQKNFSNKLNSNVKNGDGIVNKGLKGTIEKDRKVQKNLSEPVRMHDSKLMCRVCNVVLHCEANKVSHLNGKKHLAKMQSKVDSLKSK
ncbi:HVA22 protein [Trifolium repens]|nr:HVA22 protein [Trifolium repens]